MLKQAFYFSAFILLLSHCGNAENTTVGSPTEVEPQVAEPQEVPSPTPTPTPAPAPTPLPEPLSILTPEKINYQSGTELLDQLQKGGLIIFIRHEHTNHKSSDSLNADSPLSSFEDCSIQRNLTEFGTNRAALVGQSIRNLGIPIGRFMTSPKCRARQTGEAITSLPPELERNLISRGNVISFPIWREFFSTIPAHGTNTLITGHEVTIDGDHESGHDVQEEGDAFIFRPLGNNDFLCIGKVIPYEWFLANKEPNQLGYFSKSNKVNLVKPKTK